LTAETQVEILNPETIYFDVSADQTEVIELLVDQKVQITLDSFDDKEIDGQIERISLTPIQGEVGSVYKVEIAFENNPDQAKTRIGMTGDAKFILAEVDDVLKIPSRFINTDKNGKYINLNKPNNKVYITVGKEGEDEIQIIGDFKKGDTVFNFR